MVFQSIPLLVYGLINKYGTTLTISRITKGEYDPATGQIAQGEPLSQTIKGVAEEYADSIRFLGMKFETGGLIGEGDKKVMIAAYGLNNIPLQGDIVTQLGQIFNVSGVAKAVAAENVAYYVLHLKAS